jgi:hypothetical protein
MIRGKRAMHAAAGAAALMVGGCDRLERIAPLKAEPSSVTVRLPPPRTAAPGFAFHDGRKAATAPLR